MDVPVRARERSPLSSEMWHTGLLLGSAIGIMGLLALLLLFVTSRLAG